MSEITATGEGDRAPRREPSSGSAAGDAAAIAQPHRVVRASAGSGKTHRLALRYLEILFSGGRPDSIVAATFTREAAGEILGRVLTRLAAAAADPGQARRLGDELGRPELQRRQAERALRAVCTTLDRVVVGTLDSFFFRLTAALRLELGLAGVPAVGALDDPLLVALREEALEATLASLAEKGWRELVDLFERLGGAGARRSVARALDQVLLELYEIYLEAPQEELWGRLRSSDGPDADALAAAVDGLDRSLRGSGPGPLRNALATDLELAREGDWSRLLERGLAGKLASDPTATRFGSANIPPAWRGSLSVLVEHARSRVLAMEVARTKATHHLLDAFHQQYWRLRRSRGLLLFSDLAAGIERWLEEAPGGALDQLYYRIDERVGHLLLDEFQDTSLAQWSVLRPIAEEIRAWGDGSRTFFCVGDPKQAIYGWRGGCADLFDQIEDDLALDPASAERLEESFRSSQVVLDAVNLVFGGLRAVPALREHAETVERWSAAFGPHRSRTESPGAVELIESPRDADHVEWSALRVRDLAAQMSDASIAVLVHTNDQAVAMLDALRRHGVEASGEGAGAVADDPAVAAVIAALMLADHPGDSIAAFHVAGTPLGAVVGLRSSDSSAVIGVSRRLRETLIERGAAPVLAEWRRALGEEAGARGRMRLAQAVDLAERFDREGGGRPGDLAGYLSRAMVDSPRHAGVRVMTIHRAKGLEFDVVVLPALDRPLLRPPHAPVYLLRRSPLAPVEAVHRSVGASVRRLAPELEDGHRQEAARRLRDDLSVLYVGLTRARQALHLWVEPAGSSGGGREKTEGQLSFAAILRATLGGARIATENAAQDAAEESGAMLYRAGDASAVAASIASSRRASSVARQAVLPLAGRAPGDRAPALRPAVSFDDLASRAESSAATILAGVVPVDGAVRGWDDIEAILAGEVTEPPAALDAALRARVWLLGGGRRLERVERRRRLATAVRGTVVTGEIDRVWIATGSGVERRALVGTESPGGAEIERHLAARAFGLADAAVAALVRATELVFAE
jgi:ATP-dependent exoDNAse (exonuclease V) beta subunit